MSVDSARPLPLLPQRDVEAHKGDFGLVLIVGGSRGMAGAVALAGMAALRGGAGLVRLAVPDVCVDTVAGFDPSYMTVPLPSDRRGRLSLGALPEILKLARQATVVAFGPGVGRSLGLDALAMTLYEELSLPLVVDADGLNALAERVDRIGQPAAPRILTPHPGEFARLAGRKPRGEGDRIEAAAELAGQLAAVTVLKGHGTVISDGKRTVVNRTGNPGMATGGSGDVLTGLIASLVSQSLPPFEACHLGVFLHGVAGDTAAENLGQEAITARDVVEGLPAAFARYRSQRVAEGTRE